MLATILNDSWDSITGFYSSFYYSFSFVPILYSGSLKVSILKPSDLLIELCFKSLWEYLIWLIFIFI